MMQKGSIGVTTENIFPVIKKFLYSDHEIFLRELVSNAVDATQKLKTLASCGEYKDELGELKVTVSVDAEKGTLTVSDSGIGMTAEDIDKYINQIAFSGAEEFLSKYKDNANAIIGHFGLGFYSAFMVSKKVEIRSLSYKEGAKAVCWTCDGSPEYEMNEIEKATRGTDIVLYIDDDEKEFLDKARIETLLKKYCRFLPVPVVFGKEQEWKDGKYVDTDKDNVINNIEPLWTKKPSELKDEDYNKFYSALYPMAEEPLFHIHLNVDYPFTLTGILYFPKIKDQMEISRNKIQLFCNQMFVTDSVEAIVPDYLTLLHGVIDSPDIPLNVSRSYLQADSNVKMISGYITKKVADRLEEIFKKDRQAFEEKWDNVKLFIEYGMISDEKFCERALKFCLLKNTENKYFSIEDYRKGIEGNQTDKDKKLVILYATNAEDQYSYIEAAKNKGYDVLLLDCHLDSYFVNMLESKLENVKFARVDSDSIDRLIVKEEVKKPELKEEEKKALDEIFKGGLPEGMEWNVDADNLGADAAPVLITQSEFMRRYREMSKLGGGLNFYGSMPESYTLTVNLENPLVAELRSADASTEDAKAARNEKARQITDLALLANGLLKGKALSDFITRSYKLL